MKLNDGGEKMRYKCEQCNFETDDRQKFLDHQEAHGIDEETED